MLDHRLRYRLFALALLVVGVGLVPVVLQTRGPDAEADAEVVAQRIDMSLTALPRYGETMFANGAVAQAVADELGSDVDMAEVVPDHVSLVTEPDSIVFRVVGHAEDEATAGRIANTAAAAFVTELNEGGPGVGAFTLLAPAQPTDRPAAPSDPVLTDLPVVITVIFAVGVYLVFTRLTRRLRGPR